MGGQVIPWYEAPVIGMYNYTWQEKPVAPPVEEIKQYIANETYQQEKMKEGSGGIGGFLNSYVNPILNNMADDPLKTAAIIAATATGNAYLIPYIVGADTAIAGGSPADILKSAGTAYLTQAVGGEIGKAIGGDGFSGVTETGLPTVVGEGVASDVLGTTLLNEAGTTGLDSTINAIPDVLEMSKLTNDQNKAAKDYEIKMADIQSKNKQANDKMAVEKEKIAVARENMANDLAVAKENAKGRNNKKS